MKRVTAFLLTLCLLLPLAACAKAEPVDVDLTALSGGELTNEIFNLMSRPEEYAGKRVRMEGALDFYEDEARGRVYFVRLGEDAEGGKQGIEFVLRDKKGADSLPAVETHVTVTGVYGIYASGGVYYCQVTDAVLKY